MMVLAAGCAAYGFRQLPAGCACCISAGCAALPKRSSCERSSAALQPAVQPAVLFLVFRPALREQARDCAAARAIRIRSETFPVEIASQFTRYRTNTNSQDIFAGESRSTRDSGERPLRSGGLASPPEFRQEDFAATEIHPCAEAARLGFW